MSARIEEQRSLYIGTFNAEYFWKDHDHACLPSISAEAEINNIIHGMDDLLSFFCSKYDTLFTAFPVSKQFTSYLAEFGITFQKPS